MGTKNKKKRSKKRRRKKSDAQEPLASRALQFFILIVALVLLLAVFFPGIWGPVIVGGAMAGSAFPPMRERIDKWMVGKKRGQEANQAALMRMGVGLFIVVLALLGVLRL